MSEMIGGATREHRIIAGHEVEVINLDARWADCHICGEPTPCRWGVPVWNGFIVAVDWPGEWGGVPACERCHDEHARGMHVEVPTSEFYDALT